MKQPLDPKNLFSLEKGTGKTRKNSLYQQFYRQLKNAILQGKIRSNAMLWSAREISNECGISRNTVIKAYTKLCDELLIESRPRQGYFVKGISMSLLSTRGREMATIAKHIKVPSPPIPFSTSLPNVIDEQNYKRWTNVVTKFWRKTFQPPKTPEEKFKAKQLLGYSSPQGHEPLRKVICDYLNKYRAVDCEKEQIMITSGAQQCFDMIARLILDPGDPVFYEQPGYHGARFCMQAVGAELVPIAVDEYGFNIDIARTTKGKPKLIYVTPSCQFPTGAIMPLARKMQLLEFAHANKSLIIEDDHNPYTYKNIETEDSIQKLEKQYYNEQLTFYIGSLSKTLFPGIRLGYMIIPKTLIEDFVHAKALFDIHHPIIGQASLTFFIAKVLPKHINDMQSDYKERQSTLVENIQSKLINYLSFKYIREIKGNTQYKLAVEAGLELVVYATEYAMENGFDDKEFSEYAISEDRGEEKVLVRPLSSFYIDETAAEQGLVLGFGGFSDDEIIEGVDWLAKHFDTYFKEKESTPIIL